MKKKRAHPLEVASEKAVLRGIAKKRITALPAALKKKKSFVIAQKLFRKNYYKSAQSLFCYVSMKSEVATREILSNALRNGKKVYVPKVSPRSKKMEVARIYDLKKDLVKGSFGIGEPCKTLRSSERPQLDLMIIPGLAFDKTGIRLGRGGGYFDRFLGRRLKVRKVALAFREQKFRRLPCLSHDVRMDEVIFDS